MKNSKDLKFSGASDGAISPQPIRHLTLRRLRRALFGYGVLSLFLVASPATVDSAILEEVGIFSLAHRGGSEEAPENTLAAIQNAIDHGANYIECDINRTIEGVVVCFHDKDVSRTTDGEGLLAEMTLAEVKELDAGSHFDVSFAGEAVPTLEEALLLVAQVEGVAILVDPKYPHWAEDVAAAFENTGVAADNISVWADSVWWVDDIDTLIPGIPVLLRLPSNSTIEFTMEWIEDSENLAVASGVVVQSDLTDPENFENIETIVELLRVQGLPAISGVSNLSSQWDSALDLGVRGISTQKPAGLQSYFADFQCQNLMDDDSTRRLTTPQTRTAILPGMSRKTPPAPTVWTMTATVSPTSPTTRAVIPQPIRPKPIPPSSVTTESTMTSISGPTAGMRVANHPRTVPRRSPSPARHSPPWPPSSASAGCDERIPEFSPWLAPTPEIPPRCCHTFAARNPLVVIKILARYA